MTDDEYDEWNPYIGWRSDDKLVHPNAPNGGGGPGYFRSPQILGRDINPLSNIIHPFSPAGLTRSAAGINIQASLLESIFRIDIRKLPGIMRKQNPAWTVAATLMENWFARNTNDNHPDTTTIKMDAWVLKFARAKSVYDNMFTEKIYANSAAQMEIARMLGRKGLLSGKNIKASESFGDFSLPVPEIDKDYINERPVSDGWWSKASDPLDDMYGALGAFNLRMAVKGTVSRRMDKNKKDIVFIGVLIEEVGVYVRDSYDFSGDQPLGFWSVGFNSVSKLALPLYVPVENRNFRDWRTANHRGGDFLVFSDIKATSLPRPFAFEFQQPL